MSDPTGFWIRKELQNWMWTVYETLVLYQSSIGSLHCGYVEECHCTSGIRVEVLGVTMSAIYPGMVQKQGEELSWWGEENSNAKKCFTNGKSEWRYNLLYNLPEDVKIFKMEILKIKNWCSKIEYIVPFGKMQMQVALKNAMLSESLIPIIVLKCT